MEAVRPAWFPSVPGVSAFPELNVRTYVVSEGVPGIWFFSLDAMQHLAVAAARFLLNLPYHYAKASLEAGTDGIRWRSARASARGPRAIFSATYRPVGEPYRSRPGDLDHWLTERYALYSVTRRGRVFRQAIEHQPWPLQAAEAKIIENTMFAANRLPSMSGPPLVHFARSVDVWAYLPEPVF